MREEVYNLTEQIEINEQNSIKIGDIYVDPFNIKKETHDAKCILITHSHYDHFSIDDIRKVSNERTIFIAPSSMESEISVQNKIIPVLPNRTIELDNITVESVRAYNTTKLYHKKEYNWLGYIITINNIRIYICGDTDKLIENSNINCDILIVPIGGTYTMDYIEASEFANTIRPKVVIPCHYGTIVGEKELFEMFKNKVNNDIKVVEKIQF